MIFFMFRIGGAGEGQRNLEGLCQCILNSEAESVICVDFILKALYSCPEHSRIFEWKRDSHPVCPTRGRQEKVWLMMLCHDYAILIGPLLSIVNRDFP